MARDLTRPALSELVPYEPGKPVEEVQRELGLARVILPVYLGYVSAYSTLVKCGYQIDLTLVRMHRGKQEDYEDPTHLVLDDWR